MSWFDNRAIDQLTDAEVTSLVENQTPEDQWLVQVNTMANRFRRMINDPSDAEESE